MCIQAPISPLEGLHSPLAAIYFCIQDLKWIKDPPFLNCGIKSSKTSFPAWNRRSIVVLFLE